MRLFFTNLVVFLFSISATANTPVCPDITGPASLSVDPIDGLAPSEANGMVTLRELISSVLQPLLPGTSPEKIFPLIQQPKKQANGDLAVALFQFAKQSGQKPQDFTSHVADQINAKKPDWLQEAVGENGFLNLRLNPVQIQNLLATSINTRGNAYGFSTRQQGKTVVIDFGSPNVAKPMHLGHLRASVLGQAISNLATTQGYRVIGINHLGDWGVQFGKLAWAYQKWGHDYDFETTPLMSLYELYVRFNKEAEQKPELHDEGSKIFRQMELGDSEALDLWKRFVAITMQENQKLWDMLGVQHDLVRGESAYNEALEDVENRLRQRGLLTESDGAMVVCLGGDTPPCIIRKTDGASLYATRDLAAALYRREELNADESIYVVGAEQSLHFGQVFSVLEKMGFDWVPGLKHVAFGLYKLDGKKFSTRAGNVVFLEDILNQAIAKVREVVEERRADLPNKDLIIKQIAVGAVIFADLATERTRDFKFDWDRMLSFEGDSGPYVQYCGVRCQSLLAKYEGDLPDQFPMELSSPEEKRLVMTLLQYPEVVAKAAAEHKPNLLAQYLLDLSRQFNEFYGKHRIHGIDAEQEGVSPSDIEKLQQSRLLLVKHIWQTIVSGMRVLNIEVPQAM